MGTLDVSDEFVEYERLWDEEDASLELEQDDTGDGDYWNKKGDWRMLGLVDEKSAHKYKLKEDQRMLKTKKYKATKNDDNAPHENVFEVENYFWTMRGHQEIRVPSSSGTDSYLMFHPRYINRHWTWRITKKSDPSV